MQSKIASEPVTRAALRFAPLVFVWPCELAAAEWKEFDFDEATWRIPGERMKMRVSMASTLLNEQGRHRDTLERQLAHAERDRIRAADNRAEHLPERKRMTQDWADYLDTPASGAEVLSKITRLPSSWRSLFPRRRIATSHAAGQI